MPLLTWSLLAASAFAAGLLNAVAGGGSFFTLPALVFAGIAPIAANATSAVVLFPGYLGSVFGFRPELAAQPRPRLLRAGLVSAAGGLAGALLLLVTPARLFSRAVPWLLLFATVLFASGPWLMRGRRAGCGPSVPKDLGLFAISVYGGYFNGGLGILLMAFYALTGEASIHRANAMKNLNSLVLSLTSVAAFIWAGIVVWPQALAMMAAAAAGGFLGARMARRLPASWVRGSVVATGLVMAAVFFRRG
jgi:uncharacterized membrane protein YfcA